MEKAQIHGLGLFGKSRLWAAIQIIGWRSALVQVGRKSARRKMALYLSMAILTICDALRRMFAPHSRFLELSLWGMELAVVLLINFEIVSAVRHKRKIRRCHDELFELLLTGRPLHQSRPNASSPKNTASVLEWGESVKQWILKTETYLADNSPKARKLLVQLGDPPHLTESSSPILYAMFWDGALREDIKQLESIMGEMEVYF